MNAIAIGLLTLCGMTTGLKPVPQEVGEDQRAMAFGVQTSLEITGDKELLKRAAAKHRNPRPFMRQVGVLGMSSAVRRLQTVLKQSDDAVRSGRLAASLNVGPMGQGGNANSIFDLSNSMVTVGTNLVYAAQVHFGGTIQPKNAKALAIPLIPSLQRNQIGPLELDPTRELLQFIPITGNKPNVFGLLINPEVERTGKQKHKRGALPKIQGIPSIPPGPVYVLAWWVTQSPSPYLYWSDEDKREIGLLWKRWLGAT